MSKSFGSKLTLAVALSASFVLTTTTVSAADPYPTKPIELMIPWPPGGRTDLSVRLIAPYLAKALGQPVVIENKVGGIGLIGMTAVKDASPDGYTISQGGIAMAALQYQKRSSPKLSDYHWLARVYSTPLVVAVPAASKYATVKELVDAARANPKRVKHANSGFGSSTHLASEDFGKSLSVKFGQVSYKGEGPAVVGLAGEEADFSLGLMPAFTPLLNAGKLKIIGVADTKRNELYPSVPTLAEQGVKWTSYAFEAIHMPKGAAPEVIAKLTSALKATLTDPELKDKLDKIGLNLSYQNSADFTKWLMAYDKQTRELITELGLLYKE